MSKKINSDKQVETYLFCEKIKQQAKEFDERCESLMSEEELNDLQGGLKVLNLEDDEDISHHQSIVNKLNKLDEEDRY